MMDKQTNKQTGYYDRLRQKYYPFFWFVAAADEHLLAQCLSPEQDKQAGIGIAIICTTVAASLSAYYAISSLFEYWFYALPLALFWGAVIFNMDRFMVGSMRKDKKKRTDKELLLASPRIVLACLIATLISKPLEVKIFRNQIVAQTMHLNGEQIAQEIKRPNDEFESKKNERDRSGEFLLQLQKDARDINLDPAYLAAKSSFEACIAEESRIRRKIVEKQTELKRLINSATEKDPRLEAKQNLKQYINSLIRAQGELRCSSKRMLMDKRGEEYLVIQANRVSAAQRRIDGLDSSVLVARKKLDNKIIHVEDQVKVASSDILGQLSLLDKIKKVDKQMYWANLLITALFFILEIAPIMIKVLSSRGKYDSLLFLEEQRAFDNEEAELEESFQLTNMRKQAAAKSSEEVFEINEQLKSKVQGLVLKAQANLAEKIVHAWQIKEEGELDLDTQAYLDARLTTNKNMNLYNGTSQR